MSNHDQGAGAAAGFGVGFLLAGTALLLQELDLLTLRWSLLLPLIVMLTGVAVVFSGFMGAHRSRRSTSISTSDPRQNDQTPLTL
jgi:membrane-bound ClpP family serine protease